MILGILGLAWKLVKLPYWLLTLPSRIFSKIVGIVVWIVVLALLAGLVGVAVLLGLV